jgi:hypothetical protein
MPSSVRRRTACDDDAMSQGFKTYAEWLRDECARRYGAKRTYEQVIADAWAKARPSQSGSPAVGKRPAKGKR